MERQDLLTRAARCWNAMSEFRRERNRNKRFTYGDQWSDLSPETPFGSETEEEHARKLGMVPLKNNLIRRLVRNVLGEYRSEWSEPVCRPRHDGDKERARVMQKLLRYNTHINRLGEVYARTMEEFLISGMAVHKKWYGRKGGTVDCWTDFVQPDRFFVDGCGQDFRGWDISLIGEVHDLDAETMIAEFAGSPEAASRLRRLYGMDTAGEENRAGMYDAGLWTDFQGSRGAGKCRVIEVWTREHPARWHCHDPHSGKMWIIDEADYRAQVESENKRRASGSENVPPIEARWYVDDEWHWYFLTPWGEVLSHGLSPYGHGSHPYIFKAYPFLDGEIHSFVADIIDQQKLTNRLITMYNWILRSSAKGVLLVPDSAVPEGIRLGEIQDEWKRFDGVIKYRAAAGVPAPQQISSKCVDIGISELLNIQMKMMEDISGVNGALQGKLDKGSISGTLYDQQTRNSLTALADILLCFRDFVTEATRMDAGNINQFYSASRVEEVAGAGASLAGEHMSPGDVKDFIFEIKSNG